MEVSEPVEIHPLDELSKSSLIKNHQNSTDCDISPSCSLYPPIYVHHLSFWIPKKFDKSLMAHIISAAVGGNILRWKTIDEYSSECGKVSQTIELEYFDAERALGPSQAFHLHTILGQSLVNCAGITLR